MNALPLFPESASTMSGQVDALYLFLVALTAVVSGMIFLSVLVFAIKYKRRTPYEVPQPVEGSLPLELTWSIIPLLIGLIIFAWGAKVYFDLALPPENATEIFVVGKQWMWKIQHPGGQREINELHVPVGQPVKLTMTTEDVIHSFYIPAFRLKRDVIPGTYSTMWFEPTKPGVYHLFCAEYCGNQHSGMVGKVYVMEQNAYQNWLAGSGAEGSMSDAGAKLFQQLGCSTCHRMDVQGRCPNLQGVFGNPVRLRDGQQVIADEVYVRESILDPRAKVVDGFEPVMPTFQGQISEEGILQLISYIRSLSQPTDEALGTPGSQVQSGATSAVEGPAASPRGRSGRGTQAPPNVQTPRTRENNP
ncbi:MAG: cytochrome c oxidase subunit II [Bryobacteraceae bacterium]